MTSRPDQRRRRAALLRTAFAAAALALPGCAAITNPTANGIPAHILPPELLAESREGYSPIDPSLLRQPPPKQYLLAPGDILGVFVEGIIGNAENPPPVNLPDSNDLPPAIGYPFPIRADGKVSLPFLGEVAVEGLTVEDAEKKVVQAYLDKEILRETDYRIIVTLMRPRRVRILVSREDTNSSGFTIRNDSLVGLGSSQTSVGGGRRAIGQAIELPAYENDVLNALTLSGGLPGPETEQEVLVFRGGWGDGQQAPESIDPLLAGRSASRVVRIPLRVRDGRNPSIRPEDILLENGDIVVIRLRKPEIYFTGGLLPSSEHQIPFDRDLTALEAVLRARGLVLSGGLGAANFNGVVTGSGLGNPSPSNLAILRRAPNGKQVMIRVDLVEAIRDPRENLLVQADDVLLLQESVDEAVGRYTSQVLQLDLFTRFLNRGSAQGTAAASLP